MKLLKNISWIFVFILLSGCASTGKVVPAENSVENFDVNVSREKAFDVALMVAQSLNLNVAVLEKQSGLIRFETAALSAKQLDQYCEYMVIHPDSGKPWDTFQGWNQRSVNGRGGNVSGMVTINILITEKSGGSNINMRSNWIARNATETYPCNSKKVFENDFISNIKSHL